MTDVRVELAQVPTGWTSLVAPPVHLLVRLGPDDPLLHRCREAASGGLDPVLDVLLRARGLTELPDFAAVDTAEGRILARGAGCADVRGPGPSGVVRAGREPWRDAPVVETVESVVLYAVPGADPVDVPPGTDEAAHAGRPVEVSPRQPETRAEEPQETGAASRPAGSARALESQSDPEAFERTRPPPVHAHSWSEGAAKRVPAPTERSDAASENTGSGLIESVPWRGSASPWRPEPERPRSERPRPEPHTPAPSAGPTTPPAPPPPPAGAPSFAGQDEQGGDSDPGRTVDRSSLPQHDAASGPVVIGVRCPSGHPNPPTAARCRVCGSDVADQEPAPVPRPGLGVLRLSTGDQVSLDRGVLLGRSPRVPEEIPPQERPHQVRLSSPENDLSRNHVEVVLDGWQVLVRDLDSTNGTMITLPDTPPVQLRPHDLQVIEPGTVVNLSPEVSFVFEAG